MVTRKQTWGLGAITIHNTKTVNSTMADPGPSHWLYNTVISWREDMEDTQGPRSLSLWVKASLLRNLARHVPNICGTPVEDWHYTDSSYKTHPQTKLCYKGYVENETTCGSFFKGHLSSFCGNLSSVLLTILRGTREGQVTFLKDKDR